MTLKRRCRRVVMEAFCIYFYTFYKKKENYPFFVLFETARASSGTDSERTTFGTLKPFLFRSVSLF